MKLSDIIYHNDKLKKTNNNPPYSIQILSNIVVNTFDPILEYSLQKQGLNPSVNIGKYDNILQEIMQARSPANLIIVFWEIANITEDFFSRMMEMSETISHSIISSIKNDLSLFFSSVSPSSFVIMNQFTALLFAKEVPPERQEKLIGIIADLNQYLIQHAPKNIKLIYLDEVIRSVGIEQSYNKKFYQLSKALYTTAFYQSYVNYITPIILASQGKRKKAIVFDCDNTLWKGILGEDGIDNILMSSHHPEGAPFAKIQQFAVDLAKKGVIIGLCSKNNTDDIAPIFTSHPDCILRDDVITIKAINWDDKAGNLRKIAQQLNIGLDSILFVDDSDFEINQVQHELPEVTVFQVPKNTNEYPTQFQSHVLSWFQFDITEEDSNKAQFYKTQFLREAEKERAHNLQDYLRSLSLKASVFLDNSRHLKRIAQLVQKTNQFNATMIRHNEAEIEKLLASPQHQVWTLGVKDRFGEYGITGLAIVQLNGKTANLVNFLMSCRIIGRLIEQRFLSQIAQNLIAQQINQLECHYLTSSKNSLVKSFFNNVGAKYIENKNEYEIYHLDLNHLQLDDISHIEVHYETETEFDLC